MSEVNILVGLSGVGKSTVLKEAMMLSDKDYKVINYGDKMVETAKDEGLVDNRDEMKELDTKTYKRIQMNAAERIVEESEEKDVIVDTHAAIKSPFGYIPGLPKWTLENLEPSKIIMLTAEAKDIFNRSQGDGDRSREHESVEDVQEYLDVAREMAAAGAVQTGAYLKVIENEEGRAEKAAEELINTLRG
ncbi:MAG: adenylate kinase [Candidatus Nanohaloarchaea archaeon]